MDGVFTAIARAALPKRVIYSDLAAACCQPGVTDFTIGKSSQVRTGQWLLL
jgi:hypothetical protein